MNIKFYCFLILICIHTNWTFGQDSIPEGWSELETKMMSHLQKAEYDSAIVCLIEARAISVGYDSLHAIALNNLAYMYEATGKYRKAEPLYLECIALDKRVMGVDHIGYATSLDNLALLYNNMGRFKEAEPLYFKALDIRIRKKDSLDIIIGMSYNNIAANYSAMGFPEKAMKYYELALKVYKVQKNKKKHLPTLYNNMGTLLLTMKKLPQARKMHEEAISMYGEEEAKRSLTYISNKANLAEVLYTLKEYPKAIALGQEVLTLRENLFEKGHPDHLIALGKLGSYYSANQEHSKGLFLMYESLRLNSQHKIDRNNYALLKKSSTEPLFYHRAKAIYALLRAGRILRKLYKETKNIAQLKEAYELLSAASDYIQIEEKKLLKRSDKLLLLKNNVAISSLAIVTAEDLYKLTKNKQYIEDCFTYAERNKSVLLSSTLGNEEALVFGDIPKELLTQEKEIRQKQTRLEQQWIQASSSKDAQKMQKTQEALAEANLEENAFREGLQKNYPKYEALKYEVTNVSAKMLQEELLDDKTVLIEYFVYNDRVTIFLISKESIDLFSTPLNEKALNALIADLRKGLSDYKFIIEHEDKAYRTFCEAAHGLYSNLMEPFANKLEGKEQLIIVPDGNLGNIPFEVFLKTAPNANTSNYRNLPYLVRDFKISYSYSSNLLLENYKAPKQQNNGKMIAFAAAYPDAKNMDLSRLTARQDRYRRYLGPLSAAQKEVEFLEKLFKDHAFYFGKEASEANFKAKAQDYSVLHFAMHGILSEEYPLLSAMVFTEQGDSLEDNFLEAHEISNLELNSDLVVLSACETGYGKFEQGEGVLSLARSFMYAGVPSLVVSLWQVNDQSTSIIMKTFYQKLAEGASKDAALQAAKLDFLSEAQGQTAHPAFWSPFIQLGDSRAILLKTKGNVTWYWWLAGGLLLLLIGMAVFKKK